MEVQRIKIIENPDQEYVQEVRQQLKANSGYCPCALEKTEDTKCICRDFREMDDGMCRCGLYIKVRDEHERGNANSASDDSVYSGTD